MSKLNERDLEVSSLQGVIIGEHARHRHYTAGVSCQDTTAVAHIETFVVGEQKGNIEINWHHTLVTEKGQTFALFYENNPDSVSIPIRK